MGLSGRLRMDGTGPPLASSCLAIASTAARLSGGAAAPRSSGAIASSMSLLSFRRSASSLRFCSSGALSFATVAVAARASVSKKEPTTLGASAAATSAKEGPAEGWAWGRKGEERRRRRALAQHKGSGLWARGGGLGPLRRGLRGPGAWPARGVRPRGASARGRRTSLQRRTGGSDDDTDTKPVDAGFEDCACA